MDSWYTSLDFLEEDVENGALISMSIWSFPVGRADNLSVQRIITNVEMQQGGFEVITSTIEQMLVDLFRTHRAAMLLKARAQARVAKTPAT
jgi:hypothetical protein